MRHVAGRSGPAELQRNGSDHEIHRRTVAAGELASADGGPFVGQHDKATERSKSSRGRCQDVGSFNARMEQQASPPWRLFEDWA